MQRIQPCEAKANISAIVGDASRGKAAIITRRGKPRAVVLGIDERGRFRKAAESGHGSFSGPVGADESYVGGRDANEHSHKGTYRKIRPKHLNRHV